MVKNSQTSRGSEDSRYPPKSRGTVEKGVAEGIHLFNSGNFFEAHEALEAVWLKAEGDRKSLLHGLIQVAAAFHHYTRHNPAGLQSLLEKGCQKLGGPSFEAEPIDVAGFLLQLQPWRERLDPALPPLIPAPPLPKIKIKLAR
jgi:uncharacterized protein